MKNRFYASVQSVASKARQYSSGRENLEESSVITSSRNDLRSSGLDLAAGCLGTAGSYGTFACAGGCAGTFACLGTYGSFGCEA